VKRKPTRWKDQRLDAGASGWSDWQWPRHNGYRIACCDCGLVHRIDFRIDTSGRELLTIDGIRVRRRHGHVMLRVARDNRGTASHRRHCEPTLHKTFVQHASASLVALYTDCPEELDGFIRRFRAAVKRRMAAKK
jgi:hypothetical protein